MLLSPCVFYSDGRLCLSLCTPSPTTCVPTHTLKTALGSTRGSHSLSSWPLQLSCLAFSKPSVLSLNAAASNDPSLPTTFLGAPVASCSTPSQTLVILPIALYTSGSSPSPQVPGWGFSCYCSPLGPPNFGLMGLGGEDFTKMGWEEKQSCRRWWGLGFGKFIWGVCGPYRGDLQEASGRQV